MSSQTINLYHESEYYMFKIISTSPKGQWVKEKVNNKPTDGLSTGISKTSITHISDNVSISIIYQSGTKPNLVAKILATKFGDRLA